MTDKPMTPDEFKALIYEHGVAGSRVALFLAEYRTLHAENERLKSDIELVRGGIKSVARDGQIEENRRKAAEQRNATLEAALHVAVELAEEAMGYATEYFREKWRMDERLTEAKAALGGNDGKAN